MKTKIQPKDSAERQLYRELNQIKWKLKLFNETTKNASIQRILFSGHSHSDRFLQITPKFAKLYLFHLFFSCFFDKIHI